MSRPVSRAFSVATFIALAAIFARLDANAQDSARSGFRPPDTTVTYARVDSVELKLDLWFPSILRPDSATSPRAATALPRVPFVLWLHGGGWRGGSRTDPCPALPLLDSGFAVASVDYRLSTQAPWPAQIHDAKAALGWMRGHADSLGLDTGRAVAWGTSAGGHLAALLGLTTPADSLDGRVGLDSGAGGMSGRVKAAVLYHAPTDFLEYHPRRWKRGSSISQLLGCAPSECPVLARQASPATYATTDDPPVFVVHGTADSTVPVTQAWRMYAALRAADIPSELAILPGADHGGPDFVSPDMIARVSAFLTRAFSGSPPVVTDPSASLPAPR